MKLLQVDKSEFINSDEYKKRQITIGDNLLDSILDSVNGYLLDKQMKSPTTKKKQDTARNTSKKRREKTLLTLARYQLKHLEQTELNRKYGFAQDKYVHNIKTISKRLNITEQTIRNSLTDFANAHGINVEKGKLKARIPAILKLLMEQYPDSELKRQPS